MEDLDPPRVVAGSAERILEDLDWLGLGADEGPFTQSKRGDRYAAAIDALTRRGLVYPCDCSRAEIARVASAPHAGEEIVYPGTCRSAPRERDFKRAPALRVRVPEHLETDVGDFVLVRGDGVYAYQLAVVVDDLAMHITDVVRGDDLVTSTPRQIWLGQELLAAGIEGDSVPRYAHLPLVLDHEGARLAKRSPGAHVRALREAGISADEIIGALAHALGIAESPAPIAAADLCRGASPRPLRPTIFRVPAAWAAATQRIMSDK
jgi:glutamyl-tRNA synthetase